MKSEAAILVAQGAPLEVDEVEVPSPGYGQVLVELAASRICGSQLGEIDGVKGPDPWLPHLLGHEGGGTVLEVGPEVRTLAPGQAVVLHWRPGAGIEARPPVYRRGGEVVNAGAVTTFNRLAVVSENRLTPVPESVDPEVRCLLADTLTTGFGLINNDARVRIGESVVVVGCGGIGLGAVLGAHLAGAHPVVACDLYAHKLDAAARFGADVTVNLGDGADLEGAVRAALGGDGADCVIDGTGQPAVIEAAYRLARPRSGRVVGFGVMHHSETIRIHTLPLHFGLRLTGSEGGGSRPEVDIPRYVRMMADGRFDPAGFISHRYPLEQINDAVAAMRSGEVIHALIRF